MEDLQIVLRDSKIELKELEEIYSTVSYMEWCNDKYIILKKLSNSIDYLEDKINRLEKDMK